MPMQIQATALSATFAAGVAQNAAINFDIKVPLALQSVGGFVNALLRSLEIISADNHVWQVDFWSSATHGANDTDTWIAGWTFLSTDGHRINAAGNWRYFIPDLDIPLRDDDDTGKIHISLSPTDSALTAARTVVMKFFLTPEIAWT